MRGHFGVNSPMLRRRGNSKLVYDKKLRTIVTVRRSWFRRIVDAVRDRFR